MAEKERNTGMDYPEYTTPKSIQHCLRVYTECRRLGAEALVVRRKLLNRHGKPRK